MAFSKGDIAAPFIQVKEDENGVLQDIKFVNDDNFNFAYDVVDKMGKERSGQSSNASHFKGWKGTLLYLL